MALQSKHCKRYTVRGLKMYLLLLLCGILLRHSFRTPWEELGPMLRLRGAFFFSFFCLSVRVCEREYFLNNTLGFVIR